MARRARFTARYKVPVAAASVALLAQAGIERARQGGGGVVEAALPNSLAYAYHLCGRDVAADRHFAQALRKYQELGRGESDGAPS